MISDICRCVGSLKLFGYGYGLKLQKHVFFPDLRSKVIPWETYTKFLSTFFFRWVQAGNHHALATPVLRPHVSLHAQEALAEKGATRFFLTGFSMQATHLHEIDRYELIDMI
jgi:hypothetical protein